MVFIGNNGVGVFIFFPIEKALFPKEKNITHGAFCTNNLSRIC